MAIAIAEFERTLITPDSRFDDFLRGDAAALDAGELAGLRLFVDLECHGCHDGPGLGGTFLRILTGTIPAIDSAR